MILVFLRKPAGSCRSSVPYGDKRITGSKFTIKIWNHQSNSPFYFLSPNFLTHINWDSQEQSKKTETNLPNLT